MPYGFNDDKSKAQLFTKTRISAVEGDTWNTFLARVYAFFKNADTDNILKVVMSSGGYDQQPKPATYPMKNANGQMPSTAIISCVELAGAGIGLTAVSFKLSESGGSMKSQQIYPSVSSGHTATIYADVYEETGNQSVLTAGNKYPFVDIYMMG